MMMDKENQPRVLTPHHKNKTSTPKNNKKSQPDHKLITVVED